MTQVFLTESAAQEVKRLLAENKLAADTALRVSVVGGGCSGFEYRLDFETNPDAANDVVCESHGVKVVVDKKSLQFLAGTTIDYQNGILQRGFVFHNPLAVRTCGCGTSFSIS
ncbi:MAG: heme biosynthesis protein HemY [Thermogutta sp.]|nr:MAG: heme biosynthesis protein HemY [Thermogutta sp.]